MNTSLHPIPFSPSAPIDGGRLAADLRAAIAGEVRFDAGSRALYSTDASNYRQVPIGVVIPRSLDEIVETVAVCRRHGAPVLARGAGTSLAGQTCNVAVVIDTSKYLNRVLEVDSDRRLARVEPGVVCDVLRDAAERYGLTFGPDPSTHSRCTLGGMIGNNSCGAHSVMAGKTEENVEALEILTYDGLRLWVGETEEQEIEAFIRAGGRRGEIYAGLKELRERYADAIRTQFPKIRRRVSGYNLDRLLPENRFHLARALVGSEGTCVTVLQAVVRLVDSPPARVLVVLGYPDIYSAGDRSPAVLAHGPICLEGLDQRIIDDMRKKNTQLGDIALLPRGGAWLLVEIGAQTPPEATAAAERLMAAERAHATDVALYTDPRRQKQIWAIREAGAAATNSVPGEPETYPGWEDAAVDPARVGDYLRDYQKLLDRYGYSSSLYGHFGDGCIHGRITFDLKSQEGVKIWRAFLEEAADLVVRYGGSLSGEHGDGQARAELLPRMYGPEIMQALREFKTLWDPANRMNPGKLVDPYRVDQYLRTGPDYRPLDPATNFSFFQDRNSFANAAARCVGVGKCRRYQGGTMCPSYRATGEEQHSTRGRARLLFEMLQGDTLQKGWRDGHVREALELCLACKGCKGECPVQVDMATYKAEFMSHYYRGRPRPLQAYSIGLIHQWARAASLAPQLINFLSQAPGLGNLAKRLAGIAPERRIPTFAEETFTRWFARRAPNNPDKPKLILWPDTFTNHFNPQVAKAAVAVLETAGYRVTVPKRFLCCGRPLYDFGMLNQARRLLQHVLDTLSEDIAAGVPLIGLEPACVTTFQDEMLSLFPDDQRARRLSEQTFMLARFLSEHAGFRPSKLDGKALVHGHCFQKAVLGLESEKRLLSLSGMDYRVLDSGCCGMAGAFGFHRDRYAISLRVGEEVLLPAVRAAPEDTLIIADGYSCREQIAQTTGRHALHLAEVLSPTEQRSKEAASA